MLIPFGTIALASAGEAPSFPEPLAQPAHQIAVAGRTVALSGAALSLGSGALTIGCAALVYDMAVCILPASGIVIGGIGATAGIGMEAYGSYAYLRAHERIGAGPGTTAGAALLAVGGGGVALSLVADSGALFLAGSGVALVGVITLDAQHQGLWSDGERGVTLAPLVDPSRGLIGLSGTF